MAELIFCEQCQSLHTKEFGDEFHGRILSLPTVYALAFADIPLPTDDNADNA